MDQAEQHAQKCRDFESERTTIRERLHQLHPGQDMASEAVLEQLRAQSLFYRDHLTLRYGAVAESYRRAGLNYLYGQLEQFRQELEGSATIYAQILRDRQVSNAQLQAMQQQANTDIFMMQQRTLDYQRQAYAESNRRFMQTSFGHPQGAFCPRCGCPTYLCRCY
jgi:hypothetical protein